VETRPVLLKDDIFYLFEMDWVVYEINILHIDDHDRVGRLAVEEFKIRVLDIFQVSSSDVTLISSVPQIDIVQ